MTDEARTAAEQYTCNDSLMETSRGFKNSRFSLDMEAVKAHFFALQFQASSIKHNQPLKAYHDQALSQLVQRKFKDADPLNPSSYQLVLPEKKKVAKTPRA